MQIAKSSSTTTHGATGSSSTWVNPSVVQCSASCPAASRYVSSSSYKGKVQITGLGLPNQMRKYVKDGTVKKFALWNPADIGYLAAYAGAAMASGQITGKEGEKFKAGKLGEYTIGANGARTAQGQQDTIRAQNGAAGDHGLNGRDGRFNGDRRFRGNDAYYAVPSWGWSPNYWWGSGSSYWGPAYYDNFPADSNVGRNDGATSIDTITVRPVSGGSEVTYHVDLEVHGLAKLATPVMRIEFEKLGNETAARLTDVLNRLTSAA